MIKKISKTDTRYYVWIIAISMCIVSAIIGMVLTFNLLFSYNTVYTLKDAVKPYIYWFVPIIVLLIIGRINQFRRK